VHVFHMTHRWTHHVECACGLAEVAVSRLHSGTSMTNMRVGDLPAAASVDVEYAGWLQLGSVGPARCPKIPDPDEGSVTWPMACGWPRPLQAGTLSDGRRSTRRAEFHRWSEDGSFAAEYHTPVAAYGNRGGYRYGCHCDQPKCQEL
jgi:hypothetical protein